MTFHFFLKDSDFRFVLCFKFLFVLFQVCRITFRVPFAWNRAMTIASSVTKFNFFISNFISYSSVRL